MLEKELRPIKEKVEQLKKEGQANNLDPQLLMQVQMRISQAVQERFGVTDEQVMAAVDLYGAKSDPGFKDILQRIATTLSTALGFLHRDVQRRQTSVGHGVRVALHAE